MSESKPAMLTDADVTHIIEAKNHLVRENYNLRTALENLRALILAGQYDAESLGRYIDAVLEANK